MQTDPRVGVGIIIRKGDQVLLMRRNGSHGKGTWSTPGGHLEHGETPEECAVREAREETGVEVGTPRFRAVTNDVFPSEGKHYVTLWLEAEYRVGEPLIGAPDEMTSVGWFRWDHLPTPLFIPLENLVAGRCYQI